MPWLGIPLYGVVTLCKYMVPIVNSDSSKKKIDKSIIRVRLIGNDEQDLESDSREMLNISIKMTHFLQNIPTLNFLNDVKLTVYNCPTN